jgi:hypothetical protein
MDEHLLAVEEVLGGLDLYVQGLETRLARVEALLGVETDGLAMDGALAKVERLFALVGQMRNEVR